MHLLLGHQPRGRNPRRGKHERLLCGSSPMSRYNIAIGSKIEALSLLQPTNGKAELSLCCEEETERREPRKNPSKNAQTIERRRMTRASSADTSKAALHRQHFTGSVEQPKLANEALPQRIQERECKATQKTHHTSQFVSRHVTG